MKIHVYDVLKCIVLILIAFLFLQNECLFEGRLTTYRIGGIGYVLLCSFFMIKAILLQRKPMVVSVSFFFILSYVIYAIFLPGNNDLISKWGFLLWVLIPQMSFFFFFFLSYKNKITLKEINRYTIFLFFLFFLCFFLNMRNSMSRLLLNDSFEVTNNVGYYFACLVPALLLVKNKNYSLLLLCISCLFIVLSMKRGAIVLSAFSLLFFGVNKIRYTKISLKTFVWIFFLLAITFYLGSQMIMDNEYFSRRIEQTLDGDSSGRDIIYKDVFNETINQSDALSVIFGNGINYSVCIIGNFAHNDWLELFSSLGIYGVFLYFSFFISMLSFSRRISDKKEQTIFLVILFLYFFKSTISMSYFDISIIPLQMMLGYFVGQYCYKFRTI